MFWKSKALSIRICQDISTASYFWCHEAVLLEVKNSKGALRWIRQEYDTDYKASSVLMLNDKPILQADIPGCPTCEGLLATGYGIENTECPELREISDKINAPYLGIHQAVSTISPILGLLQDGMYILADCEVFPTDGNGHFFWGVSNDLTLNPSTACQLMHIEDDFHCISGIPVYLYPSQSTDKYNATRVKHYQGLLSDRQHFPRAIAYHAQGFCSVLLDGHHKAAACALHGETVPTITIMPCTGIGYKPGVAKKMIENNVNFCEMELPVASFSRKQMQAIRNTMNQWRNRENVRLEKQELIKKEWEAEYRQAAFAYPNVVELAEEIALEIVPLCYPDTVVWLKNAVGINAKKLEAVIRYYLLTHRQTAKELALSCAKLR